MPNNLDEIRLLNLREVAELVGRSTDTVNDWVRSEIFPRPIQARRGAKKQWRVSTVRAWLDTTPSLSVSEGPKGVLFYCHAGCSQNAVIDALKAHGLWPKGYEMSPQWKAAPRRGRDRDDGPDEIERFRKAIHILRAAALAKAGKPTAYLTGRGISIVPNCAMILPAPEADRLTGKRFPAMTVPITNVRGEIQGAHTTWLSKDGKSKLAVADDRPRRMYGQAKGGFVRLAPLDPDGTLIIAEGIETTLAAMELAVLARPHQRAQRI